MNENCIISTPVINWAANIVPHNLLRHSGFERRESGCLFENYSLICQNSIKKDLLNRFSFDAKQNNI